MPFVVGETVGPYRIIAQLGQGGMATVFRAYHPALDRHVAIKAMHPAFREDPNFLARFQREARVVAKLEHPGIVPIYDFAEHQGRPYLVMKFITGETLKARLKGTAMPLPEVRRVIGPVGSALAYAHQRGILHRDIKPSNVLLSTEGQVYLADFGLARIAQSGESTLSSDAMLGTPQYISPEQAMGKSDLGPSTDIYSFGVMLYEMLVGQVPFSADTPYSIIHDHIYAPLPLPRARNPRLSEGLEQVLLKALAKDPSDRFEDVPKLLRALSQAMTEAELPVEGTHQAALVTPPAQEAPGVGLDAPFTPQPEERGSEPASPVVAALQMGPGEEVTVKPGRRRWRWWYLIPILALACACGLIALSAANQRRGGSVGISTPLVTDLPGSLPGATSRPASDSRLAAALRQVEANPDDPFAHLDLAVAYWEAGQPQPAQASLEGAVQLAGDVDFFLAAGDRLVEGEFWLLAAGMYLRAVNAIPGRPPPELRDKLDLAVYLAAGEPEARALLLLRDRVDGLEPALLEVARSRYQLYQGNLALAQKMLDDLIGRNPDYAPARLLQSEILLNQGRADDARPLLEALSGLEEPGWVAGLAGIYQQEIN